MKYARILLPFIIFLFLLTVIILPYFFDVCIPDGCRFSVINVCQDGACINESLGQHLGEKSQSFTALVQLQTLILTAFLVVFLIVKKIIDDKAYLFVKLYERRRYSFSLFSLNYLIEAFSKGIVNPKIF